MLPTALLQGIKGWEVTDLRITLMEGSHHLLHTRSGDFKLAAHMAIMKALQAGDTTLLEPMLAFRVTAPDGRGIAVERTGEWIYVAWEAPKALVPNGRLWVSDESGVHSYVPRADELVLLD